MPQKASPRRSLSMRFASLGGFLWTAELSAVVNSCRGSQVAILDRQQRPVFVGTEPRRKLTVSSSQASSPIALDERARLFPRARATITRLKHIGSLYRASSSPTVFSIARLGVESRCSTAMASTSATLAGQPAPPSPWRHSWPGTHGLVHAAQTNRSQLPETTFSASRNPRGVWCRISSPPWVCIQLASAVSQLDRCSTAIVPRRMCQTPWFRAGSGGPACASDALGHSAGVPAVRGQAVLGVPAKSKPCSRRER